MRKCPRLLAGIFGLPHCISGIISSSLCHPCSLHNGFGLVSASACKVRLIDKHPPAIFLTPGQASTMSTVLYPQSAGQAVASPTAHTPAVVTTLTDEERAKLKNFKASRIANWWLYPARASEQGRCPRACASAPS